MLEVTRTGDLLIVSESPGAAYRILTWSWPALVLLGALTFGDEPALDLASSAETRALSYAALTAPFLVLVALLLGWRTTVHRFDRIAGKLVIQRGGPIRPPKVRQLMLSAISAAIDRRLPGARAIELLLSDRTTVIVTRARFRVERLDRLVRDLSETLKRPVHLAEGVLVAGRFEIERFVGQGGMGVVYRALDRRTGTPVALKLSTAPVEEDEPRERFAREMELLSTLDHPRICRYVSHGAPADGHAFLAMQWLEGEDLRAPLARGALSLEDSLHVLRCTTEAIAAVHTRGIIHRDLKPANLFLRGK